MQESRDARQERVGRELVAALIVAHENGSGWLEIGSYATPATVDQVESAAYRLVEGGFVETQTLPTVTPWRRLDWRLRLSATGRGHFIERNGTLNFVRR
ncbi:hypothetical protein [Lentisalinibacter salinarum]|uniref:hypothetical protein n=1 Tax=Lentisalinibacter salinarum TaxID=2992239 RepID=UPI00386F3E74